MRAFFLVLPENQKHRVMANTSEIFYQNVCVFFFSYLIWGEKSDRKSIDLKAVLWRIKFPQQVDWCFVIDSRKMTDKGKVDFSCFFFLYFIFSWEEGRCFCLFLICTGDRGEWGTQQSHSVTLFSEISS